jgi:hypothetical protein
MNDLLLSHATPSLICTILAISTLSRIAAWCGFFIALSWNLSHDNHNDQQQYISNKTPVISLLSSITVLALVYADPNGW